MLDSLKRFIRLSRLFDAMYPVLSVAIGAAATDQLYNPQLLPLLIVVILLNSAAMVWNDIEDRTVDAANGRKELSKSSKRELRHLIWLAAGAAGLSLVIAALVSPLAAILCFIALFVTWEYNSRPLQASRRPISSIVLLSGVGAFLPYLLGVSLAGALSWQLLAAGLFWWVGRISLSVLKDYKDAPGDAKHHKKTFLLRFGARRVARVSVATFIIGYGGFILTLQQLTDSVIVTTVLLGAVALLVFLRQPLFNPKASYKELDQTFRLVAQTQILIDSGLILWLMY